MEQNRQSQDLFFFFFFSLKSQDPVLAQTGERTESSAWNTSRCLTVMPLNTAEMKWGGTADLGKEGRAKKGSGHGVSAIRLTILMYQTLQGQSGAIKMAGMPAALIHFRMRGRRVRGR